MKVVGIFVIPLPNGRFGYGRILEKSSVANYDYFTEAIEKRVESIVVKPVLFK